MHEVIKKGEIGYGKCSQCGVADFQCGCELEIKSHTPKHPQKKEIEKIDNQGYGWQDKRIIEKLNEVIDKINKE